MERFRKTLLAAIAVSLGARFYFNFLTDGFIITFSVILLFLLIYYLNDVKPLELCLMAAVLSPLTRFAFMALFDTSVHASIQAVYPDVFFYLTYGVVFTIFTRVHKVRDEMYLVFGFLADFLSNLVELTVREGLDSLSAEMINPIFFIAIGRTAFALVIIVLFKRYSSVLRAEEHEKRYHHLLDMASKFKSEIYFLTKNQMQIERVMKDAFDIHRMSSEGVLVPKDQALRLTKDIHEVKKDYLRAIQGLEEMYDKDLNLLSMRIGDILNILTSTSDDYIMALDSDIKIVVENSSNQGIRDHFYMMSILRNIVHNAIEQSQTYGGGQVEIKSYEKGEMLIIEVRDEAGGIKDGLADYIFNFGFSTKYNEETGDVYRGIGLALTKEFVEEIYGGSINVESEKGRGTRMILAFPKINLGVNE